jgi:YidC/Oxa1 family membrane protein insertase
MYALYETILYQPLVNILVFLYQGLPYHDLGLAIILLTIAIRLALYPFVAKSLRAQKDLAALAPEIKALQERHKDNREEQAKRLMELYKERGVNPFSGCLPVLIQLPLLFTLYHVFANATDAALLSHLYSFVPRPETINPVAFGLINLAERSIPLALAAGISQFLQAYTMPQAAAPVDSPMQAAIQKQTVYVLPIVITVISFNFPAALPLYWTVLNIIGILQQGLPVRRRIKAV